MQPSVATQTVAEARGVTRDFRSGGTTVHALRGIDLRIPAGQLIALRGRSGSGKTTLLNILVGLDNPTQGQVAILGRVLEPLSETVRAQLRRESVGMLFQNAHLFPALTAQENVELPLRLARMPAKERIARSHAALDMVKLSARAQHRGLELSGGEQQRVALARSLVHSPRFVVADEPTGNLDTESAALVIHLLRDANRTQGQTIVLVTHSHSLADQLDRTITLRDGRIVDAS